MSGDDDKFEKPHLELLQGGLAEGVGDQSPGDELRQMVESAEKRLRPPLTPRARELLLSKIDEALLRQED